MKRTSTVIGLSRLVIIAAFTVVAAVFSFSPIATALKPLGPLCTMGPVCNDGAEKNGSPRKVAPAAPEETSKSRLPDDYAMPFGDNPFAPSNAATTTGGIIAAAKFLTANRCATCHADVHAQWLQSPHRNAFREPFYQKNVKDLISQRGIEFTRHCESCHNPAALFSGALTKNSKVKRPFDDDGVSCIACHSIQTAENRGIGGYVMGEPALLLKEDGTRLLKVSNPEIMADIPSHKRAMMRPLLKSPEFCAACHKSQIPRELNDYKFLRAFAVYDEYQTSSFAKQTPHPFYTRDLETCNSCHMKREAAPVDLAAKQGTIISHRWAAANTAIPTFYKFNDQLRLVKNFLENNVLGVDIFALRKRVKSAISAPNQESEELVVPINRSRFTVNPGAVITADVIITNKNIGHSFPPELRDFYEAFVEFTVIDQQTGKTLYQSGFIKPDGFLDPSAHTYQTFLVMADGTFNDKHEIWKTRAIAHNNQLNSGRSDIARYEFQVPPDVKIDGAIKLKARVRYRRFTRVFSNYALGKSVDYPIVDMASTEQILRIGENLPAAADAADPASSNPDWRRWNNYGIALLDQRQYALAADAFKQAAELNTAYRSMAIVNRAMALIELEDYDTAYSLLNQVLSADANNYRAFFQRTRILIKRGQLDMAEADLKRLLTVYPRDRISWQQYGELNKIKRDFIQAQICFEEILRIDPEDTGAHYNLMLIYRKLGRLEDAKREARIFADLKDDPAAFPIASEFLRQHPEVGNQSLLWRVYRLTPIAKLDRLGTK